MHYVHQGLIKKGVGVGGGGRFPLGQDPTPFGGPPHFIKRGQRHASVQECAVI